MSSAVPWPPLLVACTAVQPCATELLLLKGSHIQRALGFPWELTHAQKASNSLRLTNMPPAPVTPVYYCLMQLFGETPEALGAPVMTVSHIQT